MVDAPTSEETAIEALRKMLVRWMPIALMVGGASGAYFQITTKLDRNSEERAKDRADFDRFLATYAVDHDFGPGGFSNPRISAGLELTLRRLAKESGLLTRSEAMHYLSTFFQLNPTINRPNE